MTDGSNSAGEGRSLEYILHRRWRGDLILQFRQENPWIYQSVIFLFLFLIASLTVYSSSNFRGFLFWGLWMVAWLGIFFVMIVFDVRI